MNYFNRLTGIVTLAITCAFTVQGSTFIHSNQEEQTSPGAFNISVSSGQSQADVSKANVTLAGENSKVSVESAGKVTIVAGKSIVLKPGTRVTAGGFLYASIETPVKNRKNPKKEIRIVTVEEKSKIEEQANLARTCSMFSPFPSRNKGVLNTGSSNQSSYIASLHDLLAISHDQQRKVDVVVREIPAFYGNDYPVKIKPCITYSTIRPETTRILRL